MKLQSFKPTSAQFQLSTIEGQPKSDYKLTAVQDTAKASINQ